MLLALKYFLKVTYLYSIHCAQCFIVMRYKTKTLVFHFYLWKVYKTEDKNPSRCDIIVMIPLN